MKLPPGHVAGKGLVRPTGYGGYGEKMLQSMGWEKGQGLGRSSQGIKEAIQVKEKQDTTGVREESSLREFMLLGCWDMSVKRITSFTGGWSEQLEVGRQLVGTSIHRIVSLP